MQYIYIYIYVLCVCVYIGSAIFFPFSFIHTHASVYIYFFLGTEAFCEVRWSPIVLREHVLSRREKKHCYPKNVIWNTSHHLSVHTHTHTHTRIYNERWNCRWRLLYPPPSYPLHVYQRVKAVLCVRSVRREKERF